MGMSPQAEYPTCSPIFDSPLKNSMVLHVDLLKAAVTNRIFPVLIKFLLDARLE